MKTLVCFATAILALTTGGGIAEASGPIGVYALVNKVTFEPAGDQPQRIRISGVFLTADQGNPGAYSEPQAGYLYLALPRGNEEVALREWNDLKSVAGSRQVVGFGSVWFRKGQLRVRKSDEAASSPDDYPIGNGVVRINADQPRAKALLDYKER